MHQITSEEIPQEIIDQLIPQNINFREKLIRKIQESYQWNINVFTAVNKNDFSHIKKLLESHLFHFC